MVPSHVQVTGKGSKSLLKCSNVSVINCCFGRTPFLFPLPVRLKLKSNFKQTNSINQNSPSDSWDDWQLANMFAHKACQSNCENVVKATLSIFYGWRIATWIFFSCRRRKIKNKNWSQLFFFLVGNVSDVLSRNSTEKEKKKLPIFGI